MSTDDTAVVVVSDRANWMTGANDLTYVDEISRAPGGPVVQPDFGADLGHQLIRRALDAEPRIDLGHAATGRQAPASRRDPRGGAPLPMLDDGPYAQRRSYFLGGDPVHAALHVDGFVGFARLVGWALLCHARDRISGLLHPGPPARDPARAAPDPVPVMDPRLLN